VSRLSEGYEQTVRGRGVALGVFDRQESLADQAENHDHQGCRVSRSAPGFRHQRSLLPEEIDTGDRPEPRLVPEVPPATPTTCEVCGIPVPEDIREKTKPHTDRVLCIEHFSEWWNAQKEVQA